jgi:hypothetical protein
VGYALKDGAVEAGTTEIEGAYTLVGPTDLEPEYVEEVPLALEYRRGDPVGC